MTEQKSKVPGQFFQWFDSLKQGYENSIHKLFHRVEQVNEDHKNQLKTVYQSQIDGLKKSYQDHLHSLKDNYQTQNEQSEGRIHQLEKDAQFYQDQIQRQNQTIDKLNDRYDAVIFALMDNMDRQSLENVMKDISPADKERISMHLENEAKQPQQLEKPPQEQLEEPQQPPEPQVTNAFIHAMAGKMSGKDPAASKLSGNDVNNEAEIETEIGREQVLQQAFDARHEKRFEEAYQLFFSAAKAGDEKAMGAIGRAHFVGEGTTADKTTGLAWLILAAEHQFEPALKKVRSAEEKSPELYQSAWEISQNLLS